MSTNLDLGWFLMTNLSPLIEKARQKGSEMDYIQWLHRWPSCLSGAYSEWHDGHGFCEAAHVRHVNLGSGTGIKPEYCAVPLTRAEHALTHQKGDSVFAPSEWWEEQAAIYLCRWLNGVEPPECLEQEEFEDREYKLSHAGILVALWLRLKDFFAVHKDKVVTVTIKFAKRRSLKQNNTLWSEAIHGHQVREYNKNPHAFRVNALSAINMIIDRKGITPDLVHWVNKNLHNDGKSTTQLDANTGFSKYVDKIRDFDRDTHGIEYSEIISPNQFYNGDY